MAFFLRVALVCSVLAEFHIKSRSIVRVHRTSRSDFIAGSSIGASGNTDLMGVPIVIDNGLPTAMDLRSEKPLRLQKEM
jgi:hypothetical protein